ncbi:hypothetical protein Tsubulata_007061 [Turnera subulata]|uniref:Tyrosinase copper-binding domain-containing protein n=1 Tax=Turnera subulata TaxID=218843 RepID=A0A9Q0GKV4_9ROSI|nr:hypothetical protein Tsubulata_007061 [Turnera subulata]
MEAKKWGIIIVSVVFFIKALPLVLVVKESTDGHSTLIGLKPTIAKVLQGGLWSRGKREARTSGVSPNLTTCHQSTSPSGFPIYCCPPRSKSEEAIIDFKFPDPSSSPLRVRRAANLVDHNYITKYNKALSIMKSLPHTDPRSFTRQANLHCLYCTGSYNQKHSNSGFNIHKSWLFFPWHRMMLYFHERILGNLIGDDTFALPFWSWDIPEGMVIPEMYMNASLFHRERDFSHFPPNVVDLDYRNKECGLNPEDQIRTNLALMYRQMVSGAKKTELFMGCPYKPGDAGFCNAPGTIELAPHNTVHKWVGSNSNPSREDMGAFYSAARDPIFYAHHANIDRLWEVWRNLHNEMTINDPDWLESYFYFYDEKLQLNKIKVGDVLDATKLGYGYEGVDISPWLNARPKPSVPPKIARHILKKREVKHSLQPQSNHIGSGPNGTGRSLGTGLTIRVSRPRIHRSKKDKEKEEEVLVVHGIDVKVDVFVKFDVYVNVVNETIIGPRFSEFAGTFVHIPSGVKLAGQSNDAERRKTDLKLGIAEILEDLEAEGDENIWVTLLPRSQSCVNTTVDGIRIDYFK